MWRELIGNSVLFALVGLALLAYFGFMRGAWWIDVVVGSIVGGLIGLAQFAYTTAPLTLRTGLSHIGALGVAGAGVFWLFRVFQALTWPQMLAGSIGATVLMAVLITLVDYSWELRPAA